MELLLVYSVDVDDTENYNQYADLIETDFKFWWFDTECI